MNRIRAAAVLDALEREGPMTADEYISSRDLYVNSWAPTFTHLKDAELIERTGEKRTTSHGGQAHVMEITEKGRDRLRSERMVAA